MIHGFNCDPVAMWREVISDTHHSIAIRQRVNANTNLLTKSVQMTDLGRNIEALRKKLGSIERELPYAGLARKLTEMTGSATPIAASTILKWETGQGGTPNPWQLIALAKLAGVSVEEFAGRPPAADEPTPAQQPVAEEPTDREVAARILLEKQKARGKKKPQTGSKRANDR